MADSKMARVVPVNGGAAAVSAAASGGLWAAYLSALESQPVLTKSLTAAVLSAASDVIAQLLKPAEKDEDGRPLPKRVNLRSPMNQFIIGLAFKGPLIHAWLQVLDRLFASWDQSSLLTAAAKVFVDQTTFSLVFNRAYFYLAGALEGESCAAITKRLRTTFWPIIFTNMKVWSFFNLVNFKLVPPHLRVLFGNVIGLFWTVYLILVSSKK